MQPFHNGTRHFDYAAIEAAVYAWLSARPDIRAAVVIGSHGRASAYGADESADYDLLLVTTTPAFYQQTDWLRAFGPLVSAVYDPHDHVAFAHALDFFVVYEGGRNVDIVVLPYDYVQRLIRDPVAREQDFVHLITPTLAHGVRILGDPEQLVAQLAAVFPPNAVRVVAPTEAVFVQAVEDVWQRVVRLAKKLRAGHLYGAMRWQLGQVQGLLRMVEWHARLTLNQPESTWYRDNYLEQWADPRVVAALPAVYPHYDPADIQRAMFATMEVFRWVAQETAAHAGYQYNGRSDTRIASWATH